MGDQKTGWAWSRTLSHEVLEMIVDLNGDRTARGPDPKHPGERVTFAYEICNPVQTESYSIADVQVSNFVLPSYFHLETPSKKPVDFLGLSSARKDKLRPFGIRHGYAIYIDASGAAQMTTC